MAMTKVSDKEPLNLRTYEPFSSSDALESADSSPVPFPCFQSHIEYGVLSMIK